MRGYGCKSYYDRFSGVSVVHCWTIMVSMVMVRQ